MRHCTIEQRVYVVIVSIEECTEWVVYLCKKEIIKLRDPVRNLVVLNSYLRCMVWYSQLSACAHNSAGWFVDLDFYADTQSARGWKA